MCQFWVTFSAGVAVKGGGLLMCHMQRLYQSSSIWYLRGLVGDGSEGGVGEVEADAGTPQPSP